MRRLLLVLLLPALSSCAFFSLPAAPMAPADVPPVAYPADSFWYDPVPADAAVDPRSAEYIARMAEEFGRPAGSSTRFELVLVVEGGSVPVYYAEASTPRVSVPITTSGFGARGVSGVPVPTWLLPDSATDGHTVIVDPAEGIEYDFWQLRKERGRWVASAIALLDYRNHATHTDRFSANASGFPLGAGLVHPDDLAAGGSINHALVFGYPLTRLDAFVAPATRSDGWMTDPAALPMGARIQLDPDLDLDALDPPLTLPERRIALALQAYGAYLYDTGSPGSTVELNGVNPRSFATDPYIGLERYDAAGGFIDVGNIPVDRFRVLELGPVQTWGVSYPTDIAFEERYYGAE